MNTIGGNKYKITIGEIKTFAFPPPLQRRRHVAVTEENLIV